ncbi:MAG: type II toxin-antitoxin system YoeB family toxin [Spirochaetales bacterium]|nr:type II toxin-antitoxin system YoeB family toxin [Spirochaetales bacterium]
MSWTINISKQAQADLDHFRAHDRAAYLNCYRLSLALRKDPFSGPGKPAKLQGLTGEVWYRRTSIQDHMVYEVFDNSVTVASYRTHIE